MRPLYSVLFFGVLLVFIAFAFGKHLYDFSGTRHKTRAIYGLAISIFLTGTIVLQFGDKASVIGVSLLIGFIVALPWILYVKKKYKKKIVGTTLITKPRRPMQLLWFILFCLGLMFFYDSDIGKTIINAKWPLLSLCFAWAIVQAYIVYYIAHIEKKIGSRIIEGSVK